MQVGVVGAPVGQPVDQPGIAVVGEDDRLLAGEESVEILVRQAVGVLFARLQRHQVDHVDHANLQVGHPLT